MSHQRTGCSIYAGSDGAIARIAAIAVPGLRQPWFASTLIAISAPIAWRTAATRLASSSGSAASPTLTFTVRNPSATCALPPPSPWLAHADDPRNLQRVAGAPTEQLPEGHSCRSAHESCSAMSRAALAAGAPRPGRRARRAPPRGCAHRSQRGRERDRGAESRPFRPMSHR